MQDQMYEQLESDANETEPAHLHIDLSILEAFYAKSVGRTGLAKAPNLIQANLQSVHRSPPQKLKGKDKHESNGEKAAAMTRSQRSCSKESPVEALVAHSPAVQSGEDEWTEAAAAAATSVVNGSITDSSASGAPQRSKERENTSVSGNNSDERGSELVDDTTMKGSAGWDGAFDSHFLFYMISNVC